MTICTFFGRKNVASLPYLGTFENRTYQQDGSLKQAGESKNTGHQTPCSFRGAADGP